MRFRVHKQPGSTSRSRRFAGLVAVAVVTALAAAGCGGGSGGGTVKDGGVFRLGSNSSIDSLNPFIAFNSDAYTTFEYIYPFLVQYNPAVQIVPDFAKSWSTSDSGRMWTFHTVANAKWSDGKPMTAADAAWTFSTIIKFQNTATANSAGYVAHMISATAPNPTTLVLTYKQPVANVLSQVQQTPILPEHIWGKFAAGKGAALKTFTNPAPIVSGGPFTLIKYTAKQAALFKRNPSYYGPKPHILGVSLDFFTNDDAMIAALKAGQLDGVETGVPFTAVAQLRAAHFVLSETPGDAFDDFIINDNPNQLQSHKELLNPLLREAFDYAVDRKQIVSTSLLGYGAPGSTIIPPVTGSWSDPAIKPTPFSLSKAGALLDQAGYKMGPNGLRIANGHPMTYTMIMPAQSSEHYGARSFQIIQADFKKIGVQLVPQNLDDTAAYNAILANNYKNFEMSMWDWFPLTDPDFMLSVLTCDSWTVWNDSGYCSKAYDNLYSQQSAAIDPAQRRQIVYQMQEVIAKARTYLVLDYPDSIEAHSTKWTDLPLVAGGSWTSMSTIPFTSVHLAG